KRDAECVGQARQRCLVHVQGSRVVLLGTHADQVSVGNLSWQRVALAEQVAAPPPVLGRLAQGRSRKRNALAGLLDFQPGGIDLQSDTVADLLALRDGAADLSIGLMHARRTAAALEQANLDVHTAVKKHSLFVLWSE